MFAVVTGNKGDNANITVPFDHKQKSGLPLSPTQATGSQRRQALGLIIPNVRPLD